MNLLETFKSTLGAENKFSGIRPGWTIRVSQRIKEGAKTRVQAFEGIVIAQKHGTQAGGTITVRKVADGFGVEKVFPLHLPSIESVKVIKKTKVRRAKLYYLRDKTAKEIRRKVKHTKTVEKKEVAPAE